MPRETHCHRHCHRLPRRARRDFLAYGTGNSETSETEKKWSQSHSLFFFGLSFQLEEKAERKKEEEECSLSVTKLALFILWWYLFFCFVDFSFSNSFCLSLTYFRCWWITEIAATCQCPAPYICVLRFIIITEFCFRCLSAWLCSRKAKKRKRNEEEEEARRQREEGRWFRLCKLSLVTRDAIACLGALDGTNSRNRLLKSTFKEIVACGLQSRTPRCLFSSRLVKDLTIMIDS